MRKEPPASFQKDTLFFRINFKMVNKNFVPFIYIYLSVSYILVLVYDSKSGAVLSFLSDNNIFIYLIKGGFAVIYS
jgi:hypothetical protein